jgi:WD40 repeat protein
MARAQLSPDASWVVFGGYPDGEVQLWSVAENRRVRELLGHAGMVMDAVFSPDGSQVATASQDGTVRLWNSDDGSPLFTLSGHQGPVWSLAYSLDGAYLASVGQDATLRIWDPAAGSLLKSLPTQTGEWRPNTIAFSADSKTLLLAYGCVAMLECPARGAGDLRRIDLESGQIDTLLGSPVFRFTLSADRLKIGIMGRQGQLFGDLQSRQFKNIPPSPEEGCKLGGGGLSSDGNLLFAGNYAGLNVWKTDTGEMIFTMPGLAISGDMSLVSMQRLLQIDDTGALVHLWGIRKGQ